MRYRHRATARGSEINAPSAARRRRSSRSSTASADHARAEQQRAAPASVPGRHRDATAPASARQERDAPASGSECGRNANGWTSVRYTDGNAAVPQTPALISRAPERSHERQRAVDAAAPQHAAVEELVRVMRHQPAFRLRRSRPAGASRPSPTSDGDARRAPPTRSRSSSRAPAAASTRPHRRRRAGRSGLKPPIASSASRRNAMLQPGTCSAMRSSSSTCVGPPGARAMHCAIGGSSAGTTFGPPDPTTSEVRNGCTRNVSQSRSTRVSASV